LEGADKDQDVGVSEDEQARAWTGATWCEKAKMFKMSENEQSVTWANLRTSAINMLIAVEIGSTKADVAFRPI
jgi:hypothetical protein